MNPNLIKTCKILIEAYKLGNLGQTVMPEDTNPGLNNMDRESKLAYFTLPMSLNYQRDSYKLWEAALKTYRDSNTKEVFNISWSAQTNSETLRKNLLQYKLALQPNKHIHTWQTISKTINDNWGSISELMKASNNDFLQLKFLVQDKHKKGFPYLSGAKIFNYWSFIIQQYGGIKLKNSNHIDIAPDTHITQCSVKLGVITKEEAEILSKNEISDRWRSLLTGSKINPIDMHPPLWFWSRNGFTFEIK
ncbi:MAG: hypothetical protein Q8Q95_00120 [bacterium]|nr:hypothetical protein [bacterium]